LKTKERWLGKNASQRKGSEFLMNYRKSQGGALRKQPVAVFSERASKRACTVLALVKATYQPITI
jgi:hypothetical protein